jgi:hypothetical protein
MEDSAGGGGPMTVTMTVTMAVAAVVLLAVAAVHPRVCNLPFRPVRLYSAQGQSIGSAIS